EAEGAGPAADDEADVAVPLLVGRHGAIDRRHHLLAAEGDVEVDVPCAVVEAVDVLAQAEDLAAVDADALEDAVAVEEAVVEDADARLGLVEELAVDPDPGFTAFGHRIASPGAAPSYSPLPRGERGECW